MLSKVQATNFQSWADMEFDVVSGVTMIDGYNADDKTSEGSGKSSIPNALSWTIFGKLPKDVRIDDVMKDGKETCNGTVIFDNGDEIHRSRNPNQLYLKLASGELVKGKDAKETQEMIEEYVGCNFDTFCQSTYFAQNYDRKFLPANQEDKGKILSSIQNLSIFDKARKKAMDLHANESKKLVTATTAFDTAKLNLTHFAQKIEMIDRHVASKMDAFKSSKANYDASLKNAESELELANLELAPTQSNVADFQLKISNAVQTKNDLTSQREELQVQLAQLTAQSRSITQYNLEIGRKNAEGVKLAAQYSKLQVKAASLKAFIADPKGSCPTCGTELAAPDTSHSQKELADVESDLTDILGRLELIGEYLDANPTRSAEDFEFQQSSVQMSIGKLTAELGEYERLNSELQRAKIELARAESKTKAKEEALNRLLAQVPSEPDVSQETKEREKISMHLNGAKSSIEDLTLIVAGLKTTVCQLDILKDSFKDIKSHVFNNALLELNHRANGYLNQLFEVDAAIKFTTEDQKISTDILLDGRPRSLGLLSGGQNRRFNLAVDLALSDVVTSRKGSKLNLLIIDEIMKDLSEASMEKCLDLLKARKCPVVVIEHNSLFKSIVDNTFHVTLEKGTSFKTA
jgi:DNA repair exonuclease SbcCD ATPase subunit